MKAQARRLLALIMAMAMCLSLLQGVAFAAEDASVEEEPAVVEVQEAEVEEEEAPQAEEEEAPKAKEAPKAEDADEAEDEEEAVVETQADEAVTYGFAWADKANYSKGYKIDKTVAGVPETLGTREWKEIKDGADALVWCDITTRKATIGEKGYTTYTAHLYADTTKTWTWANETAPLSLKSLDWSKAKVETFVSKNDQGKTEVRKGSALKVTVYKGNTATATSTETTETERIFYRLYPVVSNTFVANPTDDQWVWAENTSNEMDGSGTWTQLNEYGKTIAVSFQTQVGEDEAGVAIMSPKTAAEAVLAPAPDNAGGLIESDDVATIVTDEVVPKWTVQYDSCVNVSKDDLESKKEINLNDKNQDGSFKVRVIDENEGVVAPTRFNYVWAGYPAPVGTTVSAYEKQMIVDTLLPTLTNNGTLKVTVSEPDANHYVTVTLKKKTGVNFVTTHIRPSAEQNTRWYTTWVWNGRSSQKVTVIGLIDTGKDGTWYEIKEDNEDAKWTEVAHKIEKGTVVYGALKVTSLPEYGINRDYLQVGDTFKTPGELYHKALYGAGALWNVSCKAQTIGATRLVINDKINGAANINNGDAEDAAAKVVLEGNAESNKVNDYLAGSVKASYYGTTGRLFEVKRSDVWDITTPAADQGLYCANFDAAAHHDDEEYVKKDGTVYVASDDDKDTLLIKDHEKKAIWTASISNVNNPVELPGNPKHTAKNVRTVEGEATCDDYATDKVSNECEFCGKQFDTYEKSFKVTSALQVGVKDGKPVVLTKDMLGTQDDKSWVVNEQYQKQLDAANAALEGIYENGVTPIIFKSGATDVVKNTGFGKLLAREDTTTNTGVLVNGQNAIGYQHYIQRFEVVNYHEATATEKGYYDVEYYCNLGKKHSKLTQRVVIDELGVTHAGTYTDVVWGKQNPDFARDPSRLFGFRPVVRDVEAISGAVMTNDGSEITLNDAVLGDIAYVTRVNGSEDYTVWRAWTHGGKIGVVTTATVGGTAGVKVRNDAAVQGDYYYECTVTEVKQPGSGELKQCQDGSALITLTVYKENATGGADKAVATHTLRVTIPAYTNHDWVSRTRKTADGDTEYYDQCTICDLIDENSHYVIPKPADPIDIAKATVTVDSAVENGTNQQPTGVIVKLGDKTLINHKDYEVQAVIGAKEPGKYDVIVNGIGAYTGTAKGVFEITKKPDEPTPVEPTKTDISGAIITGSEAYRGEYFNVRFTVVLNGVTLKENVDFVLTNGRKNNFKGVGPHSITLQGIGDYTGTAKGTIYITETTQNVTVSPTSKSFTAASLKKKAASFSISVKGAKGAVSFKSNNAKVTVSKAGKVTVKKGTKKGTYKITVKVAKNGGFKAVTKTVTITVK